jgi:spore maturation protein CgeB
VSARVLDVVVLGLSVTSSWGNGHATTYRALLREVAARGHRVRFLERDVPWYADNRDLPRPVFCDVALYGSLDELRDEWVGAVRDADVVIVGSYVPDGAAVGEWVLETAEGATAFYDIDTPVTLAKLAAGDTEYLTPALVARYDLYLSFTGGPTLRRLERELGAPRARALYCAVDPQHYQPLELEPRWDLGYMGTYSDDRQPTLERLLLEPARRWPVGRFVVAGPQYPPAVRWPANVERIEHLAPAHHPRFYAEQRYTLNVTRAAMTAAGWSPSVRLFEAAACATPIVSDAWPGLDSVFVPGQEILVAHSTEEALRLVRDVPDSARLRIGQRARARVLAEHTAAHRAEELETHVLEALGARAARTLPGGRAA